MSMARQRFFFCTNNYMLKITKRVHRTCVGIHQFSNFGRNIPRMCWDMHGFFFDKSNKKQTWQKKPSMFIGHAWLFFSRLIFVGLWKKPRHVHGTWAEFYPALFFYTRKKHWQAAPIIVSSSLAVRTSLPFARISPYAFQEGRRDKRGFYWHRTRVKVFKKVAMASTAVWSYFGFAPAIGRGIFKTTALTNTTIGTTAVRPRMLQVDFYNDSGLNLEFRCRRHYSRLRRSKSKKLAMKTWRLIAGNFKKTSPLPKLAK